MLPTCRASLFPGIALGRTRRLPLPHHFLPKILRPARGQVEPRGHQQQSVHAVRQKLSAARRDIATEGTACGTSRERGTGGSAGVLPLPRGVGQRRQQNPWGPRRCTQTTAPAAAAEAPQRRVPGQGKLGTCDIRNGEIWCGEEWAQFCTSPPIVAQDLAQTVNYGCYCPWAFGWLLLLLGGFQMAACDGCSYSQECGAQ